MPPEFLAIEQDRDVFGEVGTYHRFRSAFAALLDTRFYTIEWLDDQIYSGAARIWADGDSAFIASLKTYPTGAVELHYQITVGNLDTLIELSALAEAWARRNGAIVANIESRAGWAKAMAPHGYEVFQVCLRKEL